MMICLHVLQPSYMSNFIALSLISFPAGNYKLFLHQFHHVRTVIPSSEHTLWKPIYEGGGVNP